MRWLAAAVGALAFGLAMRAVIGGGGIGDVSAGVMLVLVAASAWLATWALSHSHRYRAAFIAVLVAVIAIDFAALPTRSGPSFDDRDALFRTDQAFSRTLTVDPSLSSGQKAAALTVVAEPVYPSNLEQPAFALAADVGQNTLSWQCSFTRGVRRYVLPLPSAALANQPTAEVRLRLSGAPTREDDYLLVYSSTERGGFLMSLVSLDEASALGADVTRCTPR